LTSVLTYHAKAGSYASPQVAQLLHLFMENNFPVAINMTSAGVRLNNETRVLTADIQARNGVVHIIDRVLEPPTQTIAELGLADPNFTHLVFAVDASGYAAELYGPGPFTVLAPTNTAVERLAAANNITLEQAVALIPNNMDVLQAALAYHGFSGWGFSADASQVSSVPSLLGQNVNIEIRNGRPVLNGYANVIATNIIATNGVVHVIDAVLLPEIDL
jgi:transforming growth factor-beta-induced protein